MSLLEEGWFLISKICIGNESKSYVENCFANAMPTVAVSEYQKLYSEQIRKWVNGNYICLRD